MPYTADFVPETLTRADVDATRGPLVLEFGTSWCGWCMISRCATSTPSPTAARESG